VPMTLVARQTTASVSNPDFSPASPALEGNDP